MRSIIAIAVGLGIGILAIRVFGVPAWLIAAITLPILLFWHRVLGAVVATSIANVRFIPHSRHHRAALLAKPSALQAQT